MRATSRPDQLLVPALFAGAAIVALVLASYLPALSAGFIWDDDSYVTGNELLRTSTGLWRIWSEVGATPQYYPLVHSSFWIEHHLWGLAPAGYHFVNVLLHAASALLVWCILRQLSVPGAWLAAALFAVHPVEVESVAWVTERKNVLSLALALAAMSSYLRFAPAETGDRPRAAPRWGWYAVALALFWGSLLSKTVVATLPAVLLVVYWWKEGGISPRRVAPLLPFFALGASFGLLTAWIEHHHVGASGEEWDFTPIDRLLIAGRALWFYAAKVVWPHPLVFFYPRWQIDSRVWWQYAFPAVALLSIASLWLARQRIGRGPLAAALIFAGVLFPALGFVNVFPMRFSFVADHFQYHASVALIALIAAGAKFAAERTMGRASLPVLAGVAWCVLAMLSAATYSQAGIYENLEALYSATIAGNPAGPTAYANLGAHLSSLGRHQEALDLARRAVLLGPRESAAHNNLGACLLRRASQPGADPAQINEAITEFQTALELAPGLADARANLATALLAQHRTGEAREQLQMILDAQPHHVEAHYALAGILAGAGELSAAADHYRAVLEQRPHYARAWNNLGVVLMNLGDTRQAIHCFEMAVGNAPDYAEAQANLDKAAQVAREQAALAQPAERAP